MIDKEHWDYRPARDDRLRWLMKIGDQPKGWWTLVATCNSVMDCIAVKKHEQQHNSWEVVTISGRFSNHPSVHEQEELLHDPHSGPYNVWGLNKPFTSQKVIIHEVEA
jgi:hypothetical protein